MTNHCFGPGYEAQVSRRWRLGVYIWLLMKVVLPLGAITFVFGVYVAFMGLDHAYPKAFANGELLIFAAIVLIEAHLELDTTNLLEEGLQLAKLIVIILSLFCLGLFIAIKLDVAKQEAQPDYQRLFLYSFCSWCVAVLAGLASIYAISYARFRKVDEEFSSFTQESR